LHKLNLGPGTEYPDSIFADHIINQILTMQGWIASALCCSLEDIGIAQALTTHACHTSGGQCCV